METRTAYKIVKTRGEKLTSVVTLREAYTMFYQVGIKTVPRVGKLFVFSDLDFAEKFLSKIQGFVTFRIMEGEAENSEPISVVCDSGKPEYFERFWETWMEDKGIKLVKSNGFSYMANSEGTSYTSTFQCLDSPSGSMVCDSFTPSRVWSLR